MILEHLRTAGVQQAHKEDRISFASVVPWPGQMICAEGRYDEASSNGNGTPEQRRAGIFVGPEFGTVSRVDLVEAAREAADAGFDALIACALSYEPHTTESDKLGRVPVLKARMNADLHMADGPDGIACWFVDTDYNHESFFVRSACWRDISSLYRYFLTISGIFSVFLRYSEGCCHWMLVCLQL